MEARYVEMLKELKVQFAAEQRLREAALAAAEERHASAVTALQHKAQEEVRAVRGVLGFKRRGSAGRLLTARAPAGR